MFFLLRYIFFTALFCSFFLSDASPQDSLKADWLRSKIQYQKRYGFIRYDRNHWEWKNYVAVEKFFKKMNQVSQNKVKILHIGDSHVQYDLQTDVIRERMQENFGYGGRGFVSAYSAAGQGPAQDYLTSHKGSWQTARNVNREPKLPLGATGITLRTNDLSASFRISFFNEKMPANFRKLKIYCQQSPESFNVLVKINNSENKILGICTEPNGKPYIEINLDVVPQRIEVLLQSNSVQQKFFECYGILLESIDNQGILYNSVGINGASTGSILKEDLLGEQLAEMKPDLVILDIGINDFAYRNHLEAQNTENRMRQIIAAIKLYSPESCILLTSVQHAYWNGMHLSACEVFAELAKKIAFDEDCAFYDYYNVSGGNFAIQKWRNFGLVKSDMLHLSDAGYKAKGELYLNALLNSYYTSLTNSKLSEFFWQNNAPNLAKIIVPEKQSIEVEPIKITKKTDPSLVAKNSKEKPVVQSVSYSPDASKTPKQVHIVRPNESLGIIAQYYGVTVLQLKEWNKINDFIHPNQKVTVFSYKKPPKIVVYEPNKISVVSPKNNTHTVVAGDNLWDLAQRYSVTVEQIKALNQLPNDKLRLGMVLRIR